MKFQDIPKFVVNLETRPDNLELIKKEMDYMGWEFETFNAINRNSYMGCTLSHLGVIEIAKERGYDRVMVIEDDCVFMPYAKSLLDDIEKQIDGIEFGVINITPTLNRKLNLSDKYDLLLDITNIPPKIDDPDWVPSTPPEFRHNVKSGSAWKLLLPTDIIVRFPPGTIF